MPDTHLFVGPHLEFLLPAGAWPECPKALTRAWHKLLNNSPLLKWNIGRGDPRVIKVGKQLRSQFCAVPISKQRRPLRPMYWRLEEELPSSGDCLTFDWYEIDREAEIRWFGEAYATELRTLEQVFGMPPPLRWGLVTWLY